jgi:hypothetical protein
MMGEIEGRNKRDLIEAVLITERLGRKASKGWDSTKIIKEQRRRNLGIV